MNLSYLRTRVFAREVRTGLLLACPSFGDPGILFCTLLPTTPLPIPVPPAAAGSKGRQPPSSLYQPPGYLIRCCQPVAHFLPHFPATDGSRFPPSPSLPYLSTAHRCQTTVTSVPGLGAAPHRPGVAIEAAGSLRDTGVLGRRGAQPGRGSPGGADPWHGFCRVRGAGTYLSPAGERRGSRRPGARAGRAAAGPWRGWAAGQRTRAFMGPRRAPHGATEPMGAGADPSTAPAVAAGVAPGVAPAAGAAPPPPPWPETPTPALGIPLSTP